jgi:hypothetical protein
MPNRLDSYQKKLLADASRDILRMKQEARKLQQLLIDQHFGRSKPAMLRKAKTKVSVFGKSANAKVKRALKAGVPASAIRAEEMKHNKKLGPQPRAYGGR